EREAVGRRAGEGNRELRAGGAGAGDREGAARLGLGDTSEQESSGKEEGTHWMKTPGWWGGCRQWATRACGDELAPTSGRGTVVRRRAQADPIRVAVRTCTAWAPGRMGDVRMCNDRESARSGIGIVRRARPCATVRNLDAPVVRAVRPRPRPGPA